ncbi:hypothetical protein [Streptomyces chromofuscus]|uniref:Uncharacterized protein n=1 Tax=Streptomyces chromofuscus TaxID=42881 RepID=A0A7M2T6H3_STRCW|nr:hypothetical protein [Streptomyces chromofuscus]QOV43071.1 hypothetical protein IPT68_25320 [Streptomyces chromofuscus]
MVQELRFDENIQFAVEVSAQQVALRPLLGGHELHVPLSISVPKFIKAGRILALETDLYGFGTVPGQRSQLARYTTSLAYTEKILIHRLHLSFPLTSLQIHAVEEARKGDISFQVDLRATLPQADGYPGSTQATDRFTIAKSRWEDQLAQLGPSAAYEMAVPYPLGDPERDKVGRTLREAQRLLTAGESLSAILQIRRALEWIQQNCGWDKPGQGKRPRDCSQSERWWRILDSLYSQTSGALHDDEITRDFDYSHAEAETLLAMTAALLRNVPGKQAA